ncbi:MAG: hypothetical protein AB7Q42_23995 [Acidimicrobiia bacterium]
MSRTCESCGADEAELWAVHRRYVTPESWDSPGSDRVLTEIELWCFACCTHYPHQPVEHPDEP